MVSINNIVFGYSGSDKKVLNDVTINFHSDKVNVIAGLNGAGKTTLFDLITKVYPLQSGYFKNLPELKDTLYQIQGTFLSLVLKGKDYVRLVFRVSGIDYSNEPSKLFKFNNQREEKLIQELWNRPLGQMSVGERRWLYITTLSKLKKCLYIFDEPTSGVDPTSRLYICKRLNDIATRENKTVIMSTHHLHELEFIDCEIFLLHEGSIKFQGSYKDFLTIYDTTNPDIAFDRCVNSESYLNLATHAN